MVNHKESPFILYSIIVFSASFFAGREKKIKRTIECFEKKVIKGGNLNLCFTNFILLILFPFIQKIFGGIKI